jgi:hypothetical protein
LEQLSLRPVEEFAFDQRSNLNQAARQTLDRLAREFGLVPWRSPVERLHALQSDLYSALVFPIDSDLG